MKIDFLNRHRQVVGLDVGSSCIKAVELRPLRKGRFGLASLGLEDLSPDCIVDGTIIAKLPVADAISRIFRQQRIRNAKVATSISGHAVKVKKLSLPLQTDQELSESIRWEAEQYIPSDVADVSIDYQVLGENSATGSLDVLLVAVRREKITDHTSVITMAGVHPVIVDVDAFALQNAYEFNYEPTPRTTVALLDIGANIMTINIVTGTEFLFTRDVSVGGQQHTEFLQKEFNLEYSQAESLKRGGAVDGISLEEAQPILDSVTEIICLEVQKSFDFFRSTTTVQRINHMLVSGGAAHTPGLLGALSKRFEMPAETFNPFRKIHYDSKRFPPALVESKAPDLAVAVGLALHTAED